MTYVNNITGLVGNYPSFYCRPASYMFELRNLVADPFREVQVRQIDSPLTAPLGFE